MLLFTFYYCLLFKYTAEGADYLSNKLCSRKSFQNVSKKYMAVFRGGGEKTYSEEDTLFASSLVKAFKNRVA